MKTKSETLKINWDLYLACAYAEGFYEGEGATKEEQIEAWQYLIDNDYIFQLHGWYGRTAHQLIEAGICKPKRRKP